MRKFAVAFALTLAVLPTRAEPPRVAVVRVSDIYRSLGSTKTSTEEFQARKAALTRDPRVAAYQKMHADLQERYKVLTARPPVVDPETLKRMQQEYVVKTQEARSVLEDYEAHRKEKSKEIDADRVVDTRKRLDRIRTVAENVAKDQGFDWLFDAGGETNTGLPLLLYAKNPTDLTDQVTTALADPLPAAPAAPTTPDTPR